MIIPHIVQFHHDEVNMSQGNSSDMSTSGRRTWDKEQAARNYEERLAREKEEAKETKNKKAGMGKLPPPAAVDSNSVQARTEALIKREELHGKRELVAPTMGIGNKGRSAGFYCQFCDLTFKDSKSWIDHNNSNSRMSKLKFD
jgi:U4/U6.U5 tri-snRNP component SNU23